MMSKKEIFAYLSLLSRYNEFQELHGKMKGPERRQFRDMMVYRLMFDKKRHDDTLTDPFMAIAPKEQT